MRMQVRRDGRIDPATPQVEFGRIPISLPRRVELYSREYVKDATEVGPGHRVAVGVRSVRKSELQAGDALVAPP
jgi:hypothetical protein